MPPPPIKTKPRIVIAGFQHETNRFGATNAAFSDFEIADSWPGILYGDAVLEGLKGSTLPLWGFADAARDEAELIPVLWCSAEPSSLVSDDAWHRITAMILSGILTGIRAGIRDAGGIDGVYLDLHGAMVTESHDDGEGALLQLIRNEVGPDLPIAISLDNHANISLAMVELANAITVFRSYPHLDMDITGARVWPIMKALIAGERPAAALRKTPFLIPLHEQFTGVEPLSRLYGEIASISNPPHYWAELATGFPASDTAETGPAIVAWAEDQHAADTLADHLMQLLLEAEPEFSSSILSPDEAVATAMALTASNDGPVILADIEDNPGAGATSDTTGLLIAMVEGGAKNAVLAMLNDPETAEEAHQRGVGAVFDARLGGKSGPHPAPFECRVKVDALSDGRFDFSGEMYRGSTADTGPSALLSIISDNASVRVAVSSKRCQCLDQAVLTHIGVEPRHQRIIAVKSTVHFRADFDPVASQVITVGSPGLNPCNHDTAGFTRLREGIRLTPMGKPFIKQ